MQLKALFKAIIIFVLIYLLLKFCFRLLSPFLFAVFICILIEPIVKIVTKRTHFNRNVSILCALLLFCFLTFFVSYFLIHNIYIETIEIIKNAPKYYDSINRIIDRYYGFLNSNFNLNLSAENIPWLKGDKIIEEIVKVFAFLKDYIVKFIYSLPGILMFITFSLISAFFISRDRERMVDFLRKSLPESVMRVASKLNSSILNIIKTEIILVLISTFETILGLMLLNVDYAILIGAISGILDILPVVGPGFIFIPWAIYNLINGKYIFALSLMLLYIILMVTRQIMETHLISGRLEIHPLIILVSIYLGLKFFGILGAVLGPLMAATFKLVYFECKSKEKI